MTRIATLTAVLATLAAPALADRAAVVAHFNQSLDVADQVVLTQTVVSTRTNSQSATFSQFNADADGQDDLRGLNGATLVSGQPAHAAAIFDRIKAESRDDD